MLWVRWPEEERQITLEADDGVDEERRSGLSSWKRRKWERWLVPSWDSKPSAVVPWGVAMMPEVRRCQWRILLRSLRHQGERLRKGKYTSIIDQDVQPLALPLELLRRLPHTVQRIQIHLQQLHAPALEHIAQCILSLGHIPHASEDACACGSHGASGLDPDAGGASCDENDLVGELAFETFIFHDLKGGGTGIAGAVGVLVDGRVAGWHGGIEASAGWD